jgi:hypothetical protein
MAVALFSLGAGRKLRRAGHGDLPDDGRIASSLCYQ